MVLDFEDSRGEWQTAHRATMWGPLRTTRRQHILLVLENGRSLPSHTDYKLRLDLRAVAHGRLTARVLPLQDPLSGHPDNPPALCDRSAHCACFAFLVPGPRTLERLPRGLLEDPVPGLTSLTPFQVLLALGDMGGQHTAMVAVGELLTSQDEGRESAGLEAPEEWEASRQRSTMDQPSRPPLLRIPQQAGLSRIFEEALLREHPQPGLGLTTVAELVTTGREVHPSPAVGSQLLVNWATGTALTATGRGRYVELRTRLLSQHGAATPPRRRTDEEVMTMRVSGAGLGLCHTPKQKRGPTASCCAGMPHSRGL